MTKRENLLALWKHKGCNEVPVGFNLCPSLYEKFKEMTGETDYADYFGFPMRYIHDIYLTNHEVGKFQRYHPSLKPGAFIDAWGVAHEPGSEEAMHMTRMRHPLINIESIEEAQAYPFPDYSIGDTRHQKKQVRDIQSRGLAAVGIMVCTIWETSWYIRSMEQLMMDMYTDSEIATYILDKVTEASCYRAAAYARAGVDVIMMGDDIGMQSSIMMSVDMYRTWIKPRLKKVIDSAKQINPDIIIHYHSCGYVIPFINDLIEAGIDVLNPIQPESMNFQEIIKEFGARLSFDGTLGTQSTMPFGTAEEVKQEVRKNLEIAGKYGGLLVAPTHMLEPEVPWENICAYVEACKEFGGRSDIPDPI